MDPRLFNSLEWRNIGPHRAGRVTAVAGHPTEVGTFYFGACAGGVWKTTNAGAYWRNISDGYFNTAAIGALAVATADPNVIYAGTGESTIRSNVSHGDGVYKSTDGGRSWTNVGLTATRHIGDILVHPGDPDTVYVAALGNAFAENPERGVYRSTDGGVTWELVLHKSSRAGSVDIAFDGGNPRIIYANVFQARRYPHTLQAGGEESGLWRSTDGGDSWQEITHNSGLPEGMVGKIGLATSPAQPGRVYAIVEAEDGALFRSEDYGETWKRLADNPDLRRRPWYYMHIIADPTDADTIWNLNVQCWKSIDGGQTFINVPTTHGDVHALWIDPTNNRRLIVGHDGGAAVSLDGGYSWSSVLNQPTAQFYHVTTDTQTPYNVYGSQQDNWAMRVPSIGFEGAISWKDYVEPGGGESGYIAVKPAPPHTVFGGGIGTGPGDGRLLAWNPETRQIRNVTVWPESMGYGAYRLKYRFQWTFPIEISPHDPNVVYVCSQHVHRSTDEGQSWEVISPDLSRNDPDKLQVSGGPITAERGAAEMYCTIFSFRESPHRAGLFWAGTDDGRVHISRDGGGSWQEITPAGLPEWSKISIIEPSPHDEATAYLAAIRYMHGDPAPYLYKTNDYGANWTKITAGIPEGEFTRTIREDPSRRGLLYAGTETGLHISFDDGASWQRFQCNLPICPIHDIVVEGTDLIAATHGRSFWILDDLSPLHQLADDTAGGAFKLFKPRDTVRYKLYGRMYDERSPKPDVNYLMTGPVTVAHDPVKTPMGTTKPRFLDAGENPPDGILIHYWLAEAPQGELTLTILDGAGNEVRAFTSQQEQAPWLPAAAGANRFVWDLRYPNATGLVGEEGKLPGNIPPKAVPGNYQLRLTFNGESQTQTVTLLPDSRLPVTQADLVAQFTLKRAIRDRLSQIHEDANRTRRVKGQVDGWMARPDATDELKAGGTVLNEKLTEIEGVLVNLDPNGRQRGATALAEKLKTITAMIDEGDYAPSRQMTEVFDGVSAAWEEQHARLNQVIEADVTAFNNLARNSSLSPVG